MAEQKSFPMLGTKVGEFKACDSEGGGHSILIYSLLGTRSFYTERGEKVLRLGKGQYQYGGFPRVSLTSNDPEAP